MEGAGCYSRVNREVPKSQNSAGATLGSHQGGNFCSFHSHTKRHGALLSTISSVCAGSPVIWITGLTQTFTNNPDSRALPRAASVSRVDLGRALPQAAPVLKDQGREGSTSVSTLRDT